MNDMIDVMTAIETYFKADNFLAFSSVEIGFYNKGHLPTFDKHLIMICPAALQTGSISGTAAGYEQDTVRLNVFCHVLNFHRRNSLIGKVSPDIGIIYMISLVKKSLYRFFRDNEITLDVRYDEMESKVNFETVFNNDRKDFVHEYPIPVSVKLKAKKRNEE
jgi:hypothetical protein